MDRIGNRRGRCHFRACGFFVFATIFLTAQCQQQAGQPSFQNLFQFMPPTFNHPAQVSPQQHLQHYQHLYQNQNQIQPQFQQQTLQQPQFQQQSPQQTLFQQQPQQQPQFSPVAAPSAQNLQFQPQPNPNPPQFQFQQILQTPQQAPAVQNPQFQFQQQQQQQQQTAARAPNAPFQINQSLQPQATTNSQFQFQTFPQPQQNGQNSRFQSNQIFQQSSVANPNSQFQINQIMPPPPQTNQNSQIQLAQISQTLSNTNAQIPEFDPKLPTAIEIIEIMQVPGEYLHMTEAAITTNAPLSNDDSDSSLTTTAAPSQQSIETPVITTTPNDEGEETTQTELPIESMTGEPPITSTVSEPPSSTTETTTTTTTTTTTSTTVPSTTTSEPPKKIRQGISAKPKLPVKLVNCGPDYAQWSKTCCEQEDYLWTEHKQRLQDQGFLLRFHPGTYVWQGGEVLGNCSRVMSKTFVFEVAEPKECSNLGSFCVWRNTRCTCGPQFVGKKHYRANSYELFGLGAEKESRF